MTLINATYWLSVEICEKKMENTNKSKGPVRNSKAESLSMSYDRRWDRHPMSSEKYKGNVLEVEWGRRKGRRKRKKDRGE